MQKGIKACTEIIHINFRIVVTYREDREWIEWDGYKGGFNSIHNVQHYKKIWNKYGYVNIVKSGGITQTLIILFSVFFNLNLSY